MRNFLTGFLSLLVFYNYMNKYASLLQFVLYRFDLGITLVTSLFLLWYSLPMDRNTSDSTPDMSGTRLSAKEAALEAQKLGLSNCDDRQIRRYCRKGLTDPDGMRFECVLSSGDNGQDQWWIERKSYRDWLEKEARIRGVRSAPDVSGDVHVEETKLKLEGGTSDTTGHNRTDPDVPIIEFLKDQIQVKDRQIDALLERDRETNHLIQGLQNMVLRLQAPENAGSANIYDDSGRAGEEGNDFVSEREGSTEGVPETDI